MPSVPLRLAGEAVVGRIGGIATKLPEELMAGTSELAWAEIKGMRIVVDQAYHGIDDERVWRTLRDDVPELHRVVGRWAAQSRYPRHVAYRSELMSARTSSSFLTSAARRR